MIRKSRGPARGLGELLNRPSRLPPTPAQQSLVDAVLEGGNLVCIAYAGSGKTGAAVEIAHQTGATGYLVLFNREAKEDAASRLPANVTAQTGHGLAFKHVIEGSDLYARKLAPELSDSNTTGAPLNARLIAQTLDIKLNPQWKIPSKANIAHLIYQTIKTFQISADKCINVDHTPENIAPPALTMQADADILIQDLRHHIASWSTLIWRKMANERDPFPIQHDTYVKLLQLRQTYISADLWLLDEYQDTTPVVADLINQQEGQKIYIGDPYQAIYGWRGAVDALRAPIDAGVPVYYLAESFRYNHQIAGLATLILRGLGESVPVQGQPRNLYPIDDRRPHTYLARNNLSLLAHAVDCARRGLPICFPGGFPRDTVTRVSSALALYEGAPEKITMGAFKQFDSWRTYTEFVHNQSHPQSDQRLLVHVIEHLARWLPRVLKLLETGYLSRPNPKAVTLMTTHRAKGRQWLYVKCDQDLALPENILDKMTQKAPLTQTERESAHLLYVAITRAQLGLTLPQAIKRNFERLASHLTEPEDSPDRFCATTETPLSGDLEEEVRRHRTDTFIRQHRKSD